MGASRLKIQTVGGTAENIPEYIFFEREKL